MRGRWARSSVFFFVMFLFVFGIASVVQYRFGTVQIVARALPKPMVELAKPLFAPDSSKERMDVDPILLEVVSSTPQYTYSGDLEEFRRDFVAYRDVALGFPRELHEEIISSDLLGAIQETNVREVDGVRVADITYPVIGDNLPGLRVSLGGIHPERVVIVVPGHPESSNPLDDLIDYGSYQKGLALRLAKEGYTVFVMGLRGFNTSSLNSETWQAIASMKSLSWYGFLTSDSLVLRKHIAAKYGVPEENIGYVGLSTGGGVSMFAASFSDTVPYAIVAGFFGSFAHNFVRERHSLSGNIAGILNYFDMQDFLIAISPRPLVVINGELDTFSARIAEDRFGVVREVYVEQGEEQNARFFSPPNLGHEYDPELILDALSDF